jgi:hypothetical protein
MNTATESEKNPSAPEVPQPTRPKFRTLPFLLRSIALRQGLASKIPVLVAFSSPGKTLAFEGFSGISEDFLVAAEPPIPTFIPRGNASPDQLPRPLPEVELVVQDRLCITQLVDVQNRPTFFE